MIADAAPRDEALVKELGADVVLPRGNDYPQRVRAAVPDGVDGFVDAALFDRLALPAVWDGGRIATLRWFSEAGERGITFHPVRVGEYAREQAKLDRLRAAGGGPSPYAPSRADPAGGAGRGSSPAPGGGRVRGRLILQF